MQENNHPSNAPDPNIGSLPAGGIPLANLDGQSIGENNPPLAFRGVVINGIDVGKLNERMADADWYYDYTEDYRVWSNGEREQRLIKAGLRLLCEDTFGLKVANQLWDRHVPEFSLRKPDFLNLKRTAQSNSQGNEPDKPVLGLYLQEYVKNVADERGQNSTEQRNAYKHL